MFFIPQFEQFTTFFFSEYQQDFPLMLTLYGIIFFHYFYILCSHFSRPIKKWLQPFKSYLSNYKMILTTEEAIAITWKIISATTRVNMATEEVITAT